MEARFAAATAAVAHGVAAELVDPQPGAIASDLLPELRRALAVTASSARPSVEACSAQRNHIDLGALRRNVRTLVRGSTAPSCGRS